MSAIALFGLAWLTDTFILQWEAQIVDTVGGWVSGWRSIRLREARRKWSSAACSMEIEQARGRGLPGGVPGSLTCRLRLQAGSHD